MLILILPSCDKSIIGPQSCEINQSPKDAYNFPIVPGTAAWDALDTLTEQLDATQVPERTARRMSTDGLVETWMRYPLKTLVLQAYSFPASIDYFLIHFNGLSELVSREDSGCKLLERYKVFDLDELPSLQDHIPLVALLSNYAVMIHLREDQLKEMIKEGYAKYETQLNHLDYYSHSTITLDLWVCARAMKYLKYQPFLDDVYESDDLWRFVETGYLPSYLSSNSFELQSVINHAQEFY